jgi:hypothetical protein
MPAPADRLDQLDALETIRRAREVQAEARPLIAQARQARETAAIIAGVPARSDLRDTSP